MTTNVLVKLCVLSWCYEAIAGTYSSCLTIYYSPYSPNLPACDFYLFGKLHLAMKGKRYADIESKGDNLE